MRVTARAIVAAVVMSAMSLLFSVASAQQQPSAGALAAARQLLELKGAFTVYNGAVVGTIENIKAQYMQTNISYQKDLNDVAVIVAKNLSGRENEIGEVMASIYAQVFTEQELKDLTTFFKSPLGQKLLTAEPRAMNASIAFMKDWAGRFGEVVNEQFRAEMHKRGKDI